MCTKDLLRSFSGGKSDMSNHRGITGGLVFAKLFAMVVECRLALWAEEHGVRVRDQTGSWKSHCTTDSIVLRSLTDKQKQARQKGRSGKLYCQFVDLEKACNSVLCCGRW